MSDMHNVTVPRMVVCAAIAYKNILIVGPRHFDSIMQSQILGVEDAALVKDIAWEQGFIDQRGEFLTRKEAWIVAEAAGQIKRRVGGDYKDGCGILYSENLY